MSMMINKIYQADNLQVLQELKAESVDLVYADPPFNTKQTRKLTHLKTTEHSEGTRRGFQNKLYATQELGTNSFADVFDNYYEFMLDRILEIYRVLKPNGSLLMHLDYREVHYIKVILDDIFGRDNFINEIIWAYDFGGRSKKKWATKHDNILWYTKDYKDYTFNYDAIDRIPYLAPGLVGAEKAKRGKVLTDCQFQTIVPTNSKERLHYPTQKPYKLIERFVKVHSNPGNLLLDPFAGTGTLGDAAAKHQRSFIMIDDNPEAVELMKKRLYFADFEFFDLKT